MEGPLDVGMMTVDVYLAASYNIGLDVFHVAEEVKHVKTVVLEAKAFEVLEVDTECIRGLFFDQFGAPWMVVFQVAGVKIEGCARCSGCG
jgi:hypothetical protein